MKQLILNLHQRAPAIFDNFIGLQAKPIITALKEAILSPDFHYLYLWGKEGNGRSHLLQAACHFASEQQRPAMYLPLKQLVKHIHSLESFFSELENLSVIAIDDIDVVIGQAKLEEALFHLYNRIHLTQTCLFISGSKPPSALDTLLPDLKSRLTSGLIFQIPDLTDDEKILLLQQLAGIDGFDIPNEVAQFLLTRCSREMCDLLTILKKLDEATLVAQRRLTIPFVKEVLGI